MSQVLNEPWLCTLFSKDMRLNVDNTKDGRRVQMFNFKRAEDRYPVTCEISDKTNYMRAALTKKSVSAFERKEERQIETVSGAAFQIQTFRIMLFRGQQPGVLKKGKRRSKIRDDECPRRIRDGQEPQLWMLITKFAHLGGGRSSIYNQPQHIKLDPWVGEVMVALLAQGAGGKAVKNEANNTGLAKQSGVASGRDERERQKRAADDATAENAEPKLDQAQKRLRPELNSSPHYTPSDPPMSLLISPVELPGQSGVHSSAGMQPTWPSAGDVPYVADIEAAWTWSSLWQSLSIQAACVSAMPVHGMFMSQASASMTSRAIPDAPRTPGRCRSKSYMPVANNRESLTIHRPNADSPACDKRHMAPSGVCDSLGGLLVPRDSGLVLADTMMDQMFGTMSSPVLENNHDMCLYGVNGGIDADMLLSEGSGWESSRRSTDR